MSLTFALVIVTYNRMQYLKRVLEAVFSLQNFDSVLTVIVVNNCSTDGTNEFLQKYAKYHSKLNILTTEQNLGGSGGFALGIESACHTGADWIGVMDDDVMLHPEVLVEIARHAEPRSILGCLRVDAKGACAERASRFYDLSTPWRGNPRHRSLCDIYENPDDARKLEEVAFCSFEGMFFSRYLVKTIGLPFPEYFVFGDDCDFCLRARIKGWRIFIVRDARLSRLIEYSRPVAFSSWKSRYVWRNFFVLHFVYGTNVLVRLKPFFFALVLALRHALNPSIKPFALLREARQIANQIRKRLHYNDLKK